MLDTIDEVVYGSNKYTISCQKEVKTVNFIRNIVSQYNLKAFGINIFPEYEAKEIFLFNCEENVNYDEIIVCKGLIKISNREQYNEYLNEKRGDLIIS